MKLQLVGSFNNNEENYFRIKVAEKKKFTTLLELEKFLLKLGFKGMFFHSYGCGEDPKKPAYQLEIGFHNFIETKDYKLHMICTEDYVHLVVKCNELKRKELIDVMMKQFTFLKVK